MTFTAEARKLEPSALVSLFRLDATEVGGVELNFTNETSGGNVVSFGGIQFFPIPVTFRGMTVSTTGPLQTPTMTLANTDGVVQEFVNTWGNLAGCRLTRWRTFARFLDDGAEPDPSAFYGPDVFKIDRKASDTPEEISWELATLADAQGVYVGRTIIRDVCMWRYRYYNPNTGSFNYDKAECPYTGSNYFDRNDQPVVAASQDEPSRTRKCCTLRFGENAELPFGGFPGILRGV
jgi:lambda family phage minor tail protein L